MSAGITDHRITKGSPPRNSSRKTSALTRMMRAVARPDVVALTVSRRRVVNLKEELQQPAITDLSWIEDDLDRFGVRAVIAVCRVENVAAGVPDPRRDHARVPSEQILHSPKTATGEHGTFGRICHAEVLSEVFTRGIRDAPPLKSVGALGVPGVSIPPLQRGCCSLR